MYIIKNMQQLYSDTPKEKIMSLKARDNMSRDFFTRLADGLTTQFGTARSLIVHILIFCSWIAINLGLIPGVHILDPFPFVFMTTIMSIEAIVLSIFVLISQNRQTLIQDVREEVDLQVNVHAEAEITKVLNLLDEIRDHLKIKSKNDPELTEMKRAMNADDIEVEVIEELEDKPKKTT